MVFSAGSSPAAFLPDPSGHARQHQGNQMNTSFRWPEQEDGCKSMLNALIFTTMALAPRTGTRAERCAAMRKQRWRRQTCIGAYLLASVCAGLAQDQHAVYPGVTVSASYAYDISGRTDRIKGFLIKVGDPQTLKNPGLVILATGIGSPGQALLKFNGKDYAVPSMEGDFSGRDGAARPARSGSAADVAGEEVIAKIVIPLKAADVVKTEGTEEAGVWDSMKCGWRKPIAEASAFQSDFAIAESGPTLLDGWVKQNNPLAVQSWKEICAYFGFRAENQQLFAGVSTVSKIGVLAPPHVPSFEVALTRESLYRALSEMNIMYDILLLHRLTSAQMLSRYKAVIIIDIPWMDAAQTSALEAYKRAGGRIYTIGSAKKFRDLSDVTMPAALFARLAEPPVRKELAESLSKLEGAPLVTIEDARYVAANLVRRNGQNRFILHLVNYDKPLKNVRVKVDFEGVADSIDSRSLRLYSPDAVGRTVNVTNSTGRILEFQVPELDVYDSITFN
jgi:hypothetical protein